MGTNRELKSTSYELYLLPLRTNKQVTMALSVRGLPKLSTTKASKASRVVTRASMWYGPDRASGSDHTLRTPAHPTSRVSTLVTTVGTPPVSLLTQRPSPPTESAS